MVKSKYWRKVVNVYTYTNERGTSIRVTVLDCGHQLVQFCRQVGKPKEEVRCTECELDETSRLFREHLKEQEDMERAS